MQNRQDTQDSIEFESVALAKSFLAGNRGAFDKLILFHKRMVFTLCYRMLGDYDDADDCAQEVFIKVSRSLKNFRFESSIETWIYRITVNTCKNKISSLAYRLRSRSVSIDAANDMDTDEKPMDIEDTTRTPAVELMRKELNRVIQLAINALPARQKMVVVLRDIEGKSYEEIVEVTGIKLGTVKSMLSRARQQLRESLKGKIPDGLS